MEIYDTKFHFVLIGMVGFAIVSMGMVTPSYATTGALEDDPFARDDPFPENDPFARDDPFPENDPFARDEEPVGAPPEAPSPCLIATAAFGSELMPQVQFLRDFRDDHILSTTSGASFMTAFDAWYYSFSPYVADYEREQPWLQQTVRTAIYPLLGILHIAENGYGLADGEGGAVLAGLIASSLIGMVYLSPATAILVLRKKTDLRKPSILVAVVLVASLGMILAGVIAENSMILMYSTALFVLSSMGMGLVAVAYLARLVQGRLEA